MESLLVFAEELERRDAQVARALDAVELLERELGELRARGSATAEFLAALPSARAARADDEQAALAALEGARSAARDAEAALERARRDADRLAGERVVDECRGALRAAELRAAEARDTRLRLEQEAVARARDAERLAARATGLAPRVRGTHPPACGALDRILEWVSRARGALLVERSGLERERETVVREASELLGSVLGEPLTAVGVEGLRGRLERALGARSA